MACVPFEPNYECCDDWDSVDPDLQERATELAWSTLRTLTAGRVGNCPAIVRPCLGPPCDPCTEWWTHHLDARSSWVRAGLRAGEWINCVCAGPECSCERLCEIVMPGPVAGIVSVTLGGVLQPSEDYRVDNGHRIVRTDGLCFPSCQDMNAPLTEPGSFGIIYIPGIVPDSAGLWAAGVLACEYSKACSGAKCRLPSTVTSIARQGVSMTFSTALFDGGLTGIREVDAYILSVNPHGMVVPPMVWSPDVPWAKHRYQSTQLEVTP